MTEKRFTYYEEDLGDMVLPKCLDNGKTVAKSVYECVDLLNQLSEENEQLKQELYQQEVSEQRRKEYDEFWKEKINKGLVK